MHIEIPQVNNTKESVPLETVTFNILSEKDGFTGKDTLRNL